MHIIQACRQFYIGATCLPIWHMDKFNLKSIPTRNLRLNKLESQFQKPATCKKKQSELEHCYELVCYRQGNAQEVVSELKMRGAHIIDIVPCFLQTVKLTIADESGTIPGNFCLQLSNFPSTYIRDQLEYVQAQHYFHFFVTHLTTSRGGCM